MDQKASMLDSDRHGLGRLSTVPLVWAYTESFWKRVRPEEEETPPSSRKSPAHSHQEWWAHSLETQLISVWSVFRLTPHFQKNKEEIIRMYLMLYVESWKKRESKPSGEVPSPPWLEPPPWTSVCSSHTIPSRRRSVICSAEEERTPASQLELSLDWELDSWPPHAACHSIIWKQKCKKWKLTNKQASFHTRIF